MITVVYSICGPNSGPSRWFLDVGVCSSTIVFTLLFQKWRDRFIKKKETPPPVAKPTNAYAGVLLMAFELPGNLKKKPFLLLGIVMPFIDVILDFIGAGIV